MSTIKIDAERVLCSVCGNKTRDKIREDTILRIVAVQSFLTTVYVVNFPININIPIPVSLHLHIRQERHP